MALAKVQRLLIHLQNKPVQFFDKSMLQLATIETVDQTSEATKVTFKLPVVQEFCNSFGPMHGGAIATAIDQFTTFAIFAADRDDRRSSSVDLSISFTSAANLGDQLTIIAECNKVGKTLAFTSAEIWSGKRLIALGKHTKYMFPEKVIE